MGWQGWFTGGMLLFMLGVLATGRFGTDIVMLGTLAVFLVTGIVDVNEAFRGFSNTGLLTVAFLYVVATGLQETGGMNLLTGRLLGRPRTAFQAQARMVAPVAAMSAFLNNTPLVAMFLPVLRELSRKAQIPAGQLFMPLSFAAILGGVCTLIGTSTNLVVFSLIEGHNTSPKLDGPPLPQMGMWTITAVGAPVALVGVLYVLLLGRRLLPSRGEGAGAAGGVREYMTAMKVAPGSPVVGKTIEQAGLRHLPGLYLSRIDRRDRTILAVEPDAALEGDDVLVFVGALESVVDLQKINGLVPVAGGAPEHYRPKMHLLEAVISPGSPLVGRTVRDSEVRTRYGAVVIAVHRHGHRLQGKVGDIVLRPGDTLLIEADRPFLKRYRHSSDFYVVSALEGAPTLRHERAWVALLVLVALVAMLSLGELPYVGKVPEVLTAMLAAGAMVLFRCCTGPQARAGVEWPVLIVIGTSFGLGKAMENTGLAGTIAGALTDAAGGHGRWALLAAVYAVTLGFTTLISNNAAAALMFPIAVGIAQQSGMPFMPLALAICLAASLEFMTPLGYQTNLMVMGPGGYRWGDYLRFGGPLTLLTGIAAVAMLALRA